MIASKQFIDPKLFSRGLHYGDLSAENWSCPLSHVFLLHSQSLTPHKTWKVRPVIMEQTNLQRYCNLIISLGKTGAKLCMYPHTKGLPVVRDRCPALTNEGWFLKVWVHML